jgi:hypothetical protein
MLDALTNEDLPRLVVVTRAEREDAELLRAGVERLVRRLERRGASQLNGRSGSGSRPYAHR